MANIAISAMVADTTPSFDDLFVMVNDPGGMPATRKVTIANLLKILGYCDIRLFMDGAGGRPAYTTWAADEAGTDITTVITAAVAAGSIVFFPPDHQYLISSAVALNSNQHLIGGGYGSKIFTTTDNINMFTGTSKSNITIEGLYLLGHNSSSAITNGNGLYFDTCDDVTIRNNVLANFGGANNNSSAILFYTTCNRPVVENNYITGGVGTSAAADICLYEAVNDFRIVGNRCYSTNSHGIYVQASGGVNGIVSGNICKSHSRHGINTYSSAVKRLVVSNNICESNGWAGIRIGGSTPTTDGYSVVEGNYLRSNGTAANSIDGNIVCDGVCNVLIANNVSETAVRRGVYCNYVGNVQILGNRMISETEDGIFIYQGIDNIDIKGNFITSPGACGIIMYGAGAAQDNIQITNNTILEPGNHAIEMFTNAGVGHKIMGNTLVKTGANALYGVWLRESSAFSIVTNTIRGFDYGVMLDNNVDLHNSVVANNTIRECITYGIAYQCSNLMIAYNQVHGNGTNYQDLGGSAGVTTYDFN